MADTVCNGFSNYETWFLQLHIFSQMEKADFGGWVTATELKNYMLKQLDKTISPSSPYNSMCRVFLNVANFNELAEHMNLD